MTTIKFNKSYYLDAIPDENNTLTVFPVVGGYQYIVHVIDRDFDLKVIDAIFPGNITVVNIPETYFEIIQDDDAQLSI